MLEWSIVHYNASIIDLAVSPPEGQELDDHVTYVCTLCSSGPVHGSPGDYAWGPQGLDDIITQMLANLEDSGPPPADEEKIAKLPKIVATKEDLALCECMCLCVCVCVCVCMQCFMQSHGF